MLNVRDLIPWSQSGSVTPGRRDLEHPMRTFQREVDRLFDDFWRGFGSHPMEGGSRGGMIAPRVDLSEDDHAIVVTAELPGIEEKDVELLLADNVLTIKGEKRAEREESEQGYGYKERSFGSFRRSLPIDAEVVEDKIEAHFKNGVLTVTLPKSPDAQKPVKKIEIKGGPAKETVEKAA